MTLRVYNTLTKQKEVFEPLVPGKVGIYVCGVTPYNYPHLGNARPYVTWDVFRRYLTYKGYQVTYIQNFTDVDDKIINRGLEEGKPAKEIAENYIKAYFEDMDALGVRRADVYPRVTEHMPEIIKMVKTLVDKGYAYVIDGDVYYDVTKFKGYGKLSGRSLEEMQAGARVEVDVRKHHPMDFALWKSAKPGEPAWESPWGPGRPGWHIECSAMSIKYLGNRFDIHGGGSDLIFPHHENEIAQTEAFTGEEPFVKYWMHNGFITVNEEKMSKSLGNFFTVREILAKFPPEAVRFLLLSAHYRSPLDFSDSKLNEALRSLERLYNTEHSLKQLLNKYPERTELAPDWLDERQMRLWQSIGQTRTNFETAMDDDFNTALAIAALFELVREINTFMNDRAFTPDAQNLTLLAKADETLMQLGDGILGLFAVRKQAKKDEDSGLIEGFVNLLIEVRQDARQRKDWTTADKIRDGLNKLGIILEDTPQGVKWRRK